MRKKMSKLYAAVVLIMISVFIVVSTFAYVLKSIPLGLDLAGGIEILYKVSSIDGEEVTQDDINATIATLNLRVNTFGLSEPSIVAEGSEFIRVRLPGVEDQNAARELLGSTAVLTFRDYQDNLLMTSDVLSSNPASVIQKDGQFEVQLKISDTNKFGEVTGDIAAMSPNNVLVTWLDYNEESDTYSSEKSACGTVSSNCISDASVNQSLSSSSVVITGVSEDQAKTLTELINSGSLSVDLTEEYVVAIDSSFGDIAIQASLLSGIIGIALIMVYMTINYRLAGFISSLGIILYTYVVFVLFFLFKGVLTLPSIAALVIGVGMSIDANVITFERIREELGQKHSLVQSFKEGTSKSFVTILDANITTLIIAIVLYIFGQSSIKGFATMFMINIFVTFVVMILFIRLILSLIVNSRIFDDRVSLFINVRKDVKENGFVDKVNKFDYVKHGMKFITCSIVILLIGVGFYFTKGLNLGVDFTSGTSIKAEIDASQFDDFVNSIDSEYTVVESSYVDTEGIAVVRLKEVLNENQISDVTLQTQEDFDSGVNVNKVSPSIGKQLFKNAGISLALGFILMVIYITIRFKSSFAFAALLALFHDLLMIIAIFAVFSLQINGAFIAALLAILGYSINDTIVVFDRIRENIDAFKSQVPSKKGKKAQIKVIAYPDLVEIVNSSLRSTLTRSLNTSLTAIIPVVALIIFGSKEILEFNIALLVGLIAGTYSSVFIASQIWVKLFKKGYYLEKKQGGLFDLSDEVHEKEF